MPRKIECHWKTAIVLNFLALVVAFFWVVDFGHCEAMTRYEGRVIDADTLAPIEGALVVAIWFEWKGGGMLAKERFRDARECLTDREGRWGFEGLAGGTRDDSDSQILSSFLTGYRHRPPQFYIYKKGYTGVGGHSAQFTGFMARPYGNPRSNLEGIILVKMGNTTEELQAYRKMNPGSLFIPLIPIDKPEQRLRALDFNFSYGSDIRRVPVEDIQAGGYVVYGLEKTTDAKQMRNGRPSLPVGACEKLPMTCKHKHDARPPMSPMPTLGNNGGVVEKAVEIEARPQ